MLCQIPPTLISPYSLTYSPLGSPSLSLTAQHQPPAATSLRYFSAEAFTASTVTRLPLYPLAAAAVAVLRARRATFAVTHHTLGALSVHVRCIPAWRKHFVSKVRSASPFSHHLHVPAIVQEEVKRREPSEAAHCSQPLVNRLYSGFRPSGI